jgi:hypothetical protein
MWPRLGQALAYLDQVYELMANFAAYTGLRWGELAALTVAQITPATRTVDVDRKIIEIGGKLFAEPPKRRKRRRTIYPFPHTPGLRPGRPGRRPHRGRQRRTAGRHQPRRADVAYDAMGCLYFNQPAYPGNDSTGAMAKCVIGNEKDCEDLAGKYAYDWGYNANVRQPTRAV